MRITVLNQHGGCHQRSPALKIGDLRTGFESIPKNPFSFFAPVLTNDRPIDTEAPRGSGEVVRAGFEALKNGLSIVLTRRFGRQYNAP